VKLATHLHPVPRLRIHGAVLTPHIRVRGVGLNLITGTILRLHVLLLLLLFYYWWGGTKSLGTAATSVLLYKPQMIDEDDCGLIGGMKIGR
jgi:hypothetical protein